MIGMMLTVDMLNGLADERKERIAVGVGAVLRNARILTEEEKAAKLAHQIFAEPDTQAEPEQIVQDRVRVLEQVKKATIEAGTVTAAE